MRKLIALSAVVFAATLSCAQAPLTAKRDQALHRIQACVHTNNVSSRRCKHVNQDVETLVQVYRSGDKSVLATLLRVAYVSGRSWVVLTGFYNEALLSDPDGFLTAMSRLSPKEQQTVAAGIAGGIHNLDRFNAIRDLLAKVPETSPTKAVAEIALKTVKTDNAALFVNYFPPRTFADGRVGNFQLTWYSRDMYQLGENQLWPPSAENENTFRFTYLGAFTGPREVTLDVLPDGSGEVKAAVVCPPSGQVKDSQLSPVPGIRVVDFLNRLDQAHFWEMPAESQHRGLDGAEWILEGVRGGKYHIVVRWCPDFRDDSPQDAAFAGATRFLLELAGHKCKDGC
jgi:hypothetical protein